MPTFNGQRWPVTPCDLGGQLELPVSNADHDLAPWEQRCHTALECLAWRGIVSTEEKGRAVEDLGATIYGSLTYYEKWAVAASHQLVEKELVTQDQLTAKVLQIVARREDW